MLLFRNHHDGPLVIRAVRIELFTARVICWASYRIFD